jgi:3-(methylthio)propanoyl-CoA dehydrogenase
MYKAPLKELRFVMHQLVRDEQLSGLEAFADYSPDFADSVLEEAGKFAEEVLAPINRAGDRQGAQWTPNGVVMPQEFKDAYAKFVEGGWPMLRAPVEHGGQGAPNILGTAIEELWASSNLAFKLCPMLSQGAVEAIERCGSAAQKARYLPKMISGEWTGTMVLTEPHGTAGRIGSRRHSHARCTGRRSLSALRSEDLHYLRRS